MRVQMIGLLVAIIGGGLLVWLGRVEDPESLVGKPAPRRGAPAPVFTLTDLNGEQHTLSDYDGQVVVLNFWATWCEPCREEMPDLQEVYDTYRDDGLVILGINADEPFDRVVEFVDEYEITFPILLDTRPNVTARYEVNAYPSTFFVDRDGRIRVDTYSGPMTASFIESRVVELLN